MPDKYRIPRKYSASGYKKGGMPQS